MIEATCPSCQGPLGKTYWTAIPGVNGPLCDPCHKSKLAAGEIGGAMSRSDGVELTSAPAKERDLSGEPWASMAEGFARAKANPPPCLDDVIAERDHLRAALARITNITAAYIQDRAEQWDAESGYRTPIEDVAFQVRQGEHLAAYEHGELDDLLEGQALTVEVAGGQLVITVGIETLATACASAPGLDSPTIVDAAAFADEVRHELTKEEEDGTTPLHSFLDAIFETAVYNGASGVICPGDDE
jgi:hypothetical protein